MYNYAYISGVLLLAPLFFIIFIKRKDLRLEMFLNGVIGGAVALATAQYFLSRYWSPVTLFNLKNSIEDFLFGFFLCSESAVIFNYFFKKYYEPYSFLNLFKTHTLRTIFTIISTPLLFFVLESVTSLNPIYNSMISILVPLALIFITSKHLIKVGLFTGVFIFFYTLFFYLVFTALFSGIITSWWSTKAISGLTLLGIPVEELLWFSLTGMYCSVSYKFASNIKFTT